MNWAHVPFEPLTAQKMPVWLQVMRQFHILERDGGDTADGLRCWLLDAYQATGEAKYLQRWAEYADDWAMNMQRDLNALPVGNVAPPGYDPVAIRRDARQAPYCWNVRWYADADCPAGAPVRDAAAGAGARASHRCTRVPGGDPGEGAVDRNG